MAMGALLTSRDYEILKLQAASAKPQAASVLIIASSPKLQGSSL